MQISPHSKIGSFCLNVVKSYQDLNFEEAGLFLADFREFCHSSAPDFSTVDQAVCERYVAAQIELLEKAVKLPPPDQIAKDLVRIASRMNSVKNYHYLGYLNALRSNDLQLSLTYLRRYFDYCMKDADSSPIQYSALNMAALYMSLNYPKKSLESIERGILYARDENDVECLSYLLYWLYQLIYESDSKDLRTPYRPSALSLLDSLYQRTELQKQYKLMAVCEVKKAKLYLEEGGEPDQVMKHLESAKALIAKHSINDLEADVELTRANAFKILGNSLMSIQCIQNLSKSSINFNATQDCHMLSQQALYFAGNGHYLKAMDILHGLKAKYPASCSGNTSRFWVNAAAVVLFKATFHRSFYSHLDDSFEIQGIFWIVGHRI